jgi:hypothetical protein
MNTAASCCHGSDCYRWKIAAHIDLKAANTDHRAGRESGRGFPTYFVTA